MSTETHPLKFYKFRPFVSPDDIKFAREIIMDHTLYASTAPELNDPFDCCGDISTEVPYDVAIEHAIEFQMRVQKRSREVARVNAPKFVEQMMQTGAKSIQQFVQSTGIISFATELNHQLLWAHYASSHKGICIEFDLEEGGMRDVQQFGPICEVKYVENRVRPNFFGDKLKVVEQLLLAKSRNWKYEREFRIILKPRPDGGHFKFPPNVLSAVYLGCRASEQTVSTVSEWLSNRSAVFKPKLFLAKPSNDKYELVFDRLM